MATSFFRTGRLILGTATCAGLLWTTAAHAQQVNVPSPPTREEIERPVQQRAERPARLTVEGDIERAPCPLADPAYANVKLTLSEARFNNLGPIAPIELRPLYEAAGFRQAAAPAADAPKDVRLMWEEHTALVKKREKKKSSGGELVLTTLRVGDST